MPRAYSLDLRERVARFVEAGRSRHAAAAHFGVSVSFVVNLMKAYSTSGRLAPKPSGGRRHAKARSASGVPDREAGGEGRHHLAGAFSRTRLCPPSRRPIPPRCLAGSSATARAFFLQSDRII